MAQVPRLAWRTTSFGMMAPPLNYAWLRTRRIVAFSLMENSHRNAALLSAGDGVAFLTFALVGLSGHERLSRPQLEMRLPQPNCPLPTGFPGLHVVNFQSWGCFAGTNSAQ